MVVNGGVTAVRQVGIIVPSNVSINPKRKANNAGRGVNRDGTGKSGTNPLPLINKLAIPIPLPNLSQIMARTSDMVLDRSANRIFSYTVISIISMVCQPVALKTPISLLLSVKPNPEVTRIAGMARAKATI